MFHAAGLTSTACSVPFSQSPVHRSAKFCCDSSGAYVYHYETEGCAAPDEPLQKNATRGFMLQRADCGRVDSRVLEAVRILRTNLDFATEFCSIPAVLNTCQGHPLAGMRYRADLGSACSSKPAGSCPPLLDRTPPTLSCPPQVEAAPPGHSPPRPLNF
jgi:hypothetical protein